MDLRHVLRPERVARTAVGSLAVGALVAFMSLTPLASANAHDAVEGQASSAASAGRESAPASTVPWVFFGAAAVLAAGVLVTGRYVRRNLRDENVHNRNRDV
ncbi:hypothetical protein [Arthrobacter sp. NPDC056727]|uniref:hypothetical protein n=1 Tax=Arthrobacter sp. NPDC056727 TaxID=3345927 RepID=UPI00366CDB84